MLPVALNLSHLHIVLVGHGQALQRRILQLTQEGVRRLTVFSDDDIPSSPEEQGWLEGYAVIPRLPETYEIRQANILMIAGLSDEKSAVLSSIARLQGVLVWVEDKPDLCDFYMMSLVRRGELTLAVSTNGTSPTLARNVKEYLGELFGEKWETISRDIAYERAKLKAQGMSAAQINEKIENYISENNLLPSFPEFAKQTIGESMHRLSDAGKQSLPVDGPILRYAKSGHDEKEGAL